MTTMTRNQVTLLPSDVITNTKYPQKKLQLTLMLLLRNKTPAQQIPTHKNTSSQPAMASPNSLMVNSPNNTVNPDNSPTAPRNSSSMVNPSSLMVNSNMANPLLRVLQHPTVHLRQCRQGGLPSLTSLLNAGSTSISLLDKPSGTRP